MKKCSKLLDTGYNKIQILLLIYVVITLFNFRSILNIIYRKIINFHILLIIYSIPLLRINININPTSNNQNLPIRLIVITYVSKIWLQLYALTTNLFPLGLRVIAKSELRFLIVERGSCPIFLVIWSSSLNRSLTSPLGVKANACWLQYRLHNFR